MTGTPEEDTLPPSLRFLKHLVTALTLTMIVGVIAIVALLVTRLPHLGSAPVIPPALVLPAGAEAAAVTMGSGWVAVVTKDDRILIFGSDGKPWQEIAIKRPAS